VKKYGLSSWELDALDPHTLEALIIKSVERYLDMDLYAEMNERLKRERETIASLVANL
jgi:hypothetical protein